MPIDPHAFTLFVIAVVVLMITPGPDMLFITANGIAGGPKAGVVSALGVGAGLLVHTALAAAGLSAIILASPVAFDLIRIVGAIYLAWLGVQAIRNPSMLELHAEKARGRSMWRVFRGGVLCNVLNPKVAVFVIAFFPQFVDLSRGLVPLQIVILGVVMTVLGTAFNALVGFSGGRIGSYIAIRPRVARAQSWVSGLIFIALAARLAVTGRSA